jgi:hypothetical protein
MDVNRTIHGARRLVVTVAVATAAVLVPAAGSTGRYVDPTGDAATAPDVTGVTVEGDARGQLLFTINVVQLPTEGDTGGLLMLDTDLNGTTGEATSGGADFVFAVDPVARLYDFGRWTGSAWDWDTPHTTVQVRATPTTLTFSVNRSELGNTTGFNFWTRTWLGDNDVDDAPDRGFWNYSVAANGPEIRRVMVTATPKAPKAGKRFTLTANGLELPPSAEPPLLVPRPDSYSCTAKLAGRALKGTGTGRCSWAVPKSARKQRLTVVVTVAYLGATKSFTFAYRVS